MKAFHRPELSVAPAEYHVYDMQPFTYRDTREMTAQEQRDTHPRDFAKTMCQTLNGTLDMLPEVLWRIKPSVDINVMFDRDVTVVEMYGRGFIMQPTDGSTWMLP